MLINDEAFRDTFPKLLDAMVSAHSSDMGSHLEPIPEMSWGELTTTWLEWCRERYGDDDG